MVKYVIVWTLHKACDLLHPLQRLPVLNRFTNCTLADWSGNLEDRWETGAWKKLADPPAAS